MSLLTHTKPSVPTFGGDHRLASAPMGADLLGGALRGAGLRGGGLAIGGALQSRSAPVPEESTPRETYHDLLGMPHHGWEGLREAASQALGNAPSDMWGPMHVKAPRHMHNSLRNIVGTATPHLAARHIESENNVGGGFHTALMHLAKQKIASAGTR